MKILAHSRLIENLRLRLVASSVAQKAALSSSNGVLCTGGKFGRLGLISDFFKQHPSVSLQSICTKVELSEISWQASSNAILLRKLESTLKEHQLNEAWEAFSDFKRLYGFPEISVVSRLINVLSYSSEPKFLKKACDLILLIQKKRPKLLKLENLTTLSLSLARAQMPLPCSVILRLMLEKEILPPMNVLSSVFLHMVKTDIGTCLASNILIEICNYFQNLSAKRHHPLELVRPDTMIFNLVLDACVSFGSPFKGQQIIELMSDIGVVADAHSIVIITRIHEMNGLRDEVKKFKPYISRALRPFLHHYWQFYESLLSLHFTFDDIDSAAELILEMCRLPESGQKEGNGRQNHCFVSIGSQHLREGLKLQIAPALLQNDSVLKLNRKQELASCSNGEIVLSNKTLAKLINCYKRGGRIDKLSELLFSLQVSGSSKHSSVCRDAIAACLNLGWLETAHDILDYSENAGHALDFTIYKFILSAYLKQNMFKEAKALLKQMRKVGFVINLPEEKFLSTCLAEEVDNCLLHALSTERSNLPESLSQEVTEQEKEMRSTLYELNSSIYYFCKAKMIEDALRTYRRMQELNIQPTATTFAFFAHGYSSMGMFREITILWGDIKRNMENGNLIVSKDIYEFLLLNFIHGGYFERVMEVIHYMREQNMFIDKWFYKNEFLKLHKNLYRNITALSARSEAQSKRLEYVQAFRKWAGIN